MASTGCGDAGKHYNPTKNYGELSGKYGTLPLAGSVTYTSSEISFDGQYSILGRSVIIHDNTTSRFGCCTIKLIDDEKKNDTGLAASILKCKMSGYSFSFENVMGQQKTTVFYNVTDGTVKPPANANSNAIQIFPNGDCANMGTPALYSDTNTFQSTNGNSLQFNLGVLADLGGWAGRSMVRYDINATTVLDCCTFTQFFCTT